MTTGQRAEFSHRVTAADTAAQLGSGDVAVLGTPRVLALMERATVQAVARSLEPGETSVGVSVHLEHLAASPVGATVDVEAVVQERTVRRITCTARMSAGERTLATANIVRVVVNRATFEAGTG